MGFPRKKRQTTVEPAEKALRQPYSTAAVAGSAGHMGNVGLVLCQTSKMNVAKCNDDAICEVLVTRPVAGDLSLEN